MKSDLLVPQRPYGAELTGGWADATSDDDDFAVGRERAFFFEIPSLSVKPEPSVIIKWIVNQYK